MVFETYIFKYFKVRIVDSHSLDLLVCVFRVCIAVFYQQRRALYTNIFQVLRNREIRNIENKHATAILRNKRQRKYKTEKSLLNLAHVGFY